MKNLLNWIIKWVRSLLRLNPKIETKKVIGRAIVKKDRKSGAKQWITYNDVWLDAWVLPPNENLELPVKLFKANTVIEIRGEIEETTDNVQR